jgi:antitoxin Phd
MTKSYSIAAARGCLPQLVHGVEAGKAVELTRRGRPVAMLLSIEEYRRLEGQKADFRAALQSFRAGHDLSVFEDDDIYRDIRDKSPGRVVEI